METKNNYYALQVKTGGEDKFIELFCAAHDVRDMEFHFPKREIRDKKKGILIKKSKGIFSGYVFVCAAAAVIDHYAADIKRIKGFGRFLKSNTEICPLAGKDLEIVTHFTKRIGSVAGISKVRFDENQRIVVLEGPLVGLAGSIIKIDKRKKRARVKLDLYDDSFSIDLAFDVIAGS